MIEKIKLHNYVYGFVFSLIEFSIIIVVVGFFMTYYFLHGKLFYGIIALGIVLNSLVIVIFSVLSLQKKEKDIGIIKFLNKKIRNEIYKCYPLLNQDTYILSILILVPFLLIVLSFRDVLKKRLS